MIIEIQTGKEAPPGYRFRRCATCGGPGSRFETCDKCASEQGKALGDALYKLVRNLCLILFGFWLID